MSRFRPVWQYAIALLLCLAVNGCFPAGDSQLDEEKEPHFLTGRNRASAMNFPGAIESFEKALEVNPHSASAHFELGWLYEKEGDPAAAIYHYQRFLRFRPGSEKADLVQSRIKYCKAELATSVSALGPMPQAGHDYERLMLENRDLKALLLQWQTSAAASHLTAPASPPVESPAPVHESPTQAPQTVRVESRPPGSASTVASGTPPAVHLVPVSLRTYTVRSGDTPSAIARKCGVSVNSLLAANPQVRPTRMQPGQVLTLPVP
jgi:LysM repeat protein